MRLIDHIKKHYKVNNKEFGMKANFARINKISPQNLNCMLNDGDYYVNDKSELQTIRTTHQLKEVK